MPRKYRKVSLYAVALAVAFFFLFLPKENFSSFKLSTANLVSLPMRIISVPLFELKKILYYHRTFSEYRRLRGEVASLKTRLIGLEEVVRENQRLEQLLGFKRNLIFSSVLADVVARDPTNWNASIIVNKGEKDGITVGMPVVHVSGVVGRIAEVSKETSRVVLLNDPQFSLTALVQRPREVGLLSGTLQGNCRLRYIPAAADVGIGDKVITSKLSSAFPEGLLIGEIVGVNFVERGVDAEFIVEPAVPLSKLEEVLIVQK